MEDVLEDILAKVSKQVDHAEIYAESGESVNVDILNGKVNHANEESIKGIGIRVINNQKQGFAYTTNMDNIDQIIQQAITNSKLNEEDENITLIQGGNKYPTVKGLYDKKLENFQLQEAIEFSKHMIELAEEKKCNPSAGLFTVGIEKSTLLNTNGVNVTHESTSCCAEIEVNVEDNDAVSSAYYYDISHENNMDAQFIVDKATTLALASRNAQPTHTRDTQVVLDFQASLSLLQTFFSALSSENKQRGRSQFKDKINQQVISDKINLTDDGRIDGALCSSIADGEGSPSQKTPLIENGVLKNFIYDTYHANKDEANVETTSNAVRSGYNSVPTVGFTNLKLDFDEVTPIEELTEAITVNNVMGAHTANPITGDFSVEVMNAFEIRNGERRHPIKKAMISGNIFEIMKSATAATKDTRQLGSLITPKILVKSLRVIA